MQPSPDAARPVRTFVLRYGVGALAVGLVIVAAVAPERVPGLQTPFVAVSAGGLLGAWFAGIGRRRSERELWDSRELLRITLASIGDAAVATDTDGRLTFMNTVAESLTGWQTAEAVGQPLTTVFRIINEQTRQPVENPVQKALREGFTVGLSNHTILTRKDGTELSIDDSAAPIRDARGDVAGCILIFRDITERRRLELENAQRLGATRLLAAIVESSQDAIISKSLDGVIQSWNAAAYELLGYTAEEAIGQHVSFIIPPERAEEEDRILALLRAGERVEHFDTVRLRRDGERIPVSLTVSPIKDDAGRVIGASKIMRDITDKKEAERRIYGLLAQLTETDRRKDEFLAMLGHELRNPLAAVRNAVAIAGMDETRRPRALEIASRQTDQLGRLIDDLLDVARITQGRITLRKERADLAQILARAIDSTRGFTEARGVQLALALPQEPIRIEADPARLEQVFVNLLSNAAKYNNTGGRIDVAVAQRADKAIVRIRDTGIGIAPDVLPRMWDLFAQADRALDRSQGGLGIGLTVARRLVELHGAHIEAHSEGLGKGAEFVVTLPTLPVVSGEERSVGAAPALPQRSTRVLVVEDNPDAAESLTMLLELLGHRVRVVYNGTAALQAARANVPDVMLVDIGLPDIDGFEVARRVRRDRALEHVVLVALTGYGRDDDKEQTMRAGFDYHLVKPVSPDALHGLVTRLGKDEPIPPPTVH